MPGLVGIIGRMDPCQARSELDRMVKTLEHERFYQRGIWTDTSLGIYVGWVLRPSLLADLMPLRTETGQVTLLFSGEDYSQAGIGVSGGSRPLAERFVSDPTFPAGLDGIFQGLAIDHRCGYATLFNDRFGLHRVYYCEHAEAFYFAAEAKAILAIRPETHSMDLQGVAESVSLGCVLQNRSLFRAINLLPPASAWEFRNASLTRKGKYFHPRQWEEQEPLDPPSYYRAMRDCLVRTVPGYLRANEGVGLALTGGLDTRAIIALGKPAPGCLPCYTYGGPLRESRDVRIARRVAALCDQPHQVLAIGEHFLSRFASYAERTVYLTDGCASVANAPDLYLSEQARAIAPIKVVGTWGSELLRQVVLFKSTPPPLSLFQPELQEAIRKAAATYSEVRRGHPVTFTAFRQTPWYQYGIEALEQTQICLRAPFLANEVVSLVYRAPQPSEADIRARLIAESNPTLAAIPCDRAGPLDARWPTAVLMRLFHEFNFRAEYAFDVGMPQWLARVDRALRPLRLDRLFLGQHKFLHFRTWYRDSLATYIREILLDPLALSRPYLRPQAVRQTVETHITGRANHTDAIHRLLTLELLHRSLATYGSTRR